MHISECDSDRSVNEGQLVRQQVSELVGECE